MLAAIKAVKTGKAAPWFFTGLKALHVIARPEGPGNVRHKITSSPARAKLEKNGKLFG
jgi:hypothetical protein